MVKEYFKREETCLKEGAIVVLEMEGIQKLLKSCSVPWWRKGYKLRERFERISNVHRSNIYFPF